MKITVFTTTTCAMCAQLKRFLDYKKIKYDSVNLDEHPERRGELEALSGLSIVPQTLIQATGELPQIIVGYNLSQLSKAVL